ncbi:hypothetical protein [Chondromyces crocatus]|uniref:Uncharacterized protein n=1 Tax=Chondromyces crocatus TaxID=52 RepID=A0A0K1ESJ7_CHOCO|nr:hypothetical protein [Chondromyces crocatus]AKT43578.1 uncharacterized protein CMC5_078110 [Chondromyces crocatus]
MPEKIRADLIVPKEQDLLVLLFEVLSVELTECGGTWEGAAFGGTTFTVIPDLKIDGHYEMIVSTDRSHPYFSEQQRSFVPVERLPDWLGSIFAAEGVDCKWGSSEEEAVD